MHDELQIPRQPTQIHTPSPRDLAAVFFRHKRLFIISFSAVLVLGVLYGFLATSYTARMKVVVRHGRIDPAVSPTQTVAPLMQNDAVTEEELNSEVELFRDEDVLREVVLRTGLADRNSWISWLRRESREQRIEHAVRRLAKNLDVEPVRKSQLITISYRASDPRLAASVLKVASEVYLARQVQMQRPRGQQVFFDEQVNISHRELKRVQQESENFTRTHNVVSAALERDLVLQKLSEAQASEFGLQATMAETVERSRALDAKLRELPPRRVSQVRNADNPQLQEKLKSSLLELELRRTELLTRFQPSYRLVQERDQQIAQAKAALDAENLTPLRDELTEDNPDYTWANSERVKTSVEIQALQRREAIARQQLAAYQSRAQQLAQSVIEQADLEQKLKAAEERYLLYAGKREEARIGDALDQTGILNVAVAQPPAVPALPSWPLWMATCLSFAAALAFSTGSVFVADYADRTVRTPNELTALLGAPVLASLPQLPNYRRATLRSL